jgi:hypothetical protein
MGAVGVENFFQEEILLGQDLVGFRVAPALKNCRVIDFSKKKDQCAAAFA